MELRSTPLKNDLPKLDIIENLSAESVQDFQRVFIPKQFDSRQLIQTPQAGGGTMYLIFRGDVSLYQVTPAGKRVIIDVLGPNDIFGDIDLLLTSHRHEEQNIMSEQMRGEVNNYAETLSPSTIGVAQKENVAKLVERHPEMSLRIIDSLVHRLQTTEFKVNEMAVQSVSDRIIMELTRLCTRYGCEDGQDWYVLQKKLTHESLANLIGVSREAVTRNLAALNRRGVVVSHNGYFRLRKSPAQVDLS